MKKIIILFAFILVAFVSNAQTQPGKISNDPNRFLKGAIPGDPNHCIIGDRKYTIGTIYPIRLIGKPQQSFATPGLLFDANGKPTIPVDAWESYAYPDQYIWDTTVVPQGYTEYLDKTVKVAPDYLTQEYVLAIQ